MSRVEMEALYPALPGESAIAWTNRVLSHASEHGTNRQCSIGWHGECSDPEGYECNCLCHGDGVQVYTVEGFPRRETMAIKRVAPGKLHWPPVDGEPEGTWAHWVYADSAHDAVKRAIAKQQVILDAEAGSITDPDDGPGILLTRDQLQAWAGRELTDDEVSTIDMAIPNSGIPESIATIADSILPD